MPHDYLRHFAAHKASLIASSDVLFPRSNGEAQIQWRSSDPTVEPFLGNLSGITPTHFHFLYKASRELIFLLLYQSSSSLVISSTPTHRIPQVTKLPQPFPQDIFENLLKATKINILKLVSPCFFIFSFLFSAFLLDFLSFLETSSCIISVHLNG